MKRLIRGGAWTLGRLMAVLPPLVCLLLCVVIGYREFQNSRSDIVRLVTDEISRSVNAEVSIKDISASVPGRLVVKDLRISKKGYGTLISAEKGVIHYSLREIIAGYQQPLAAVQSLDLYTPVVNLERFSNGRINLVEAFKTSEKKKAEGFSGPVVIRDAKVVFTDNTPPSKRTGRFVFVLSGINGKVDITDKRGGLFTATVAASNVAESLTLRGGYTLAQELIVSGRVKGAKGALLSKYAIADQGYAIGGGSVTGDFLVSFDPQRKQQIDAWLNGQVNNASVTLGPDLPSVQRINGRLKIAGIQTVSFDGSAFSAGTSFRVKGSVTGLQKPVVWVDASTSAADYQRLTRYASRYVDLQGARIAGAGPINVKLRGPLEDLSVAGDFAIPGVSFRGQTLSAVRGSIVRNGNTVTFKSLSANAAGGRLAGNGMVSFGKTIRATGQGRFSEAPAELLHPDLSGVFSGDFSLQYRDGRQTGRIAFAATEPAFRETRFTTAIGKARLSGSVITIDSLTVSTVNGFASAAGKVNLKDSSMDLQVSASGLNLANLSRAVDVDIDGFADAQGTVEGAIQDPVFAGDVYLSEIRYLGNEVDTVLGSLTISRERMTTDRLVIGRDGSEVIVDGVVDEPLSPSRRFDLNARVTGVELSEIAEYSPGLSGMHGRISGTINNVSGNIRNLRAGFDLIVEQAQYGEFDAPLVSIEGSYDRGLLVVDNLTAERGQATASLSGSLGRDQSLDFVVDIRNLSLSQALDIAVSDRIPVSGDLNFNGTVTGSVANPVVSGSLLQSTFNTVGQQITVSETPLQYIDDVVRSTGFTVNAASGIISVKDLSFDLAVGNIEADIQFGGQDRQQPVNLSQIAAIARGYVIATDFENPSLRSALLNLPEQINGNLIGTLDITSQNDLPTARLQATVTDLSLRGRSLGELNAQALASQDSIAISRLTIEKGDAQVVASGSVSYDGSINADIEGFNLPVLELAGYQRPEAKQGTADFSFQASGTLGDPLVEGSVLVSNVNVEGIDIEQISTGRILIDKDSIDFAEASLTSGPHVITIAGTAPFSITKGQMVEGGDTRLEAELANPDLDVLTVFSDFIDADKTQGAAEANLLMQGPWPKVQVNGFVKVEDGSIGIHNMSTTLRNIQVDITSDGNSVDINRFNISSSDGGKLEISGGAQLTAQGWQMQVKADTKDFGLKFRDISQRFQESYQGKVDLSLAANGAVVKPDISGRVEFHDGSIGLPTVPETVSEPATLAFNPGLNIALEAGRRLRVRSSRINVSVGGGVRLVNNLQNPAVNGSLSVTDGYLLFPGSRFRVVPVGSINFRYEPPEPTRVTVDIRAETEISNAQTSAVQDYRVEMSVTGPLSDPKVSFASYPPGLETSRILAMLGQQAGIGPGGFGGQQGFESEIAGILTTSVAPTFLEPIETALADAFGFQEVALGFGGKLEPVSVMVRRRLNSKISVSLLQYVGEREEQREWKLSYDINRRLRVSYGETRFGDRVISLEGGISF